MDMKHEFGTRRPDILVEDWPGKYSIFSWMEYAVNVPDAIFIVTTRKPNGVPNANLHSWGMLVGEGEEYFSILAMLKSTHTYANILREREWCLNYPCLDKYPEAFETIYANTDETDEVTAAGFSLEKAQTVQVPRIKECPINLECQLEWDKPLFPNSQWQLFCGKVTHIALDSTIIAKDPEDRVRKFKPIYNIRSVIDPRADGAHSPCALGVIEKVVKIYSDDLQPMWKENEKKLQP